MPKALSGQAAPRTGAHAPPGRDNVDVSAGSSSWTRPCLPGVTAPTVESLASKHEISASARAVGHGDEHVMKLADTAADMFAGTSNGDP